MNLGNLISVIITIVTTLTGTIGAAILWKKHAAEARKTDAETNGIRAKTTLTDIQTIRQQSDEIAELSAKIAKMRARCTCGAVQLVEQEEEQKD